VSCGFLSLFLSSVPLAHAAKEGALTRKCASAFLLRYTTSDLIQAKFVAAHWDFVVLGVGTGVGSGLIGIGGGLVMNLYMGVCTDMPQVSLR
jgi:uncharacterized membrane protein YfcA